MKLKTLLLAARGGCFAMPSQTAMRRARLGRQVNIIYWQAPSILNPFLSGGTKDVESPRS